MRPCLLAGISTGRTEHQISAENFQRSYNPLFGSLAADIILSIERGTGFTVLALGSRQPVDPVSKREI